MIMPPQDQKKTKSRTILVSGSCTWFGTIIDQMKLMWRLPQPFMLLSDIYTLFDGLAYNTCGYFASCVVFFRKNTSNEQNVRSYYMLNHRIRGLSFHYKKKLSDNWLLFFGKSTQGHLPWSQRFFLIFLRERDQQQAAKR